MKYVHMVAFVLLLVGGVAWGIYGLTGTDVVYAVLGDASNIVFILVGLAAIYEIVVHRWNCRECNP